MTSPKIPLIVSHPEIAGRLVNLTLSETLTQGSDKKVQWYCENEPHIYEASAKCSGLVTSSSITGAG